MGRSCTTVRWIRRRPKACCCTKIRETAFSYQPSAYAGGFLLRNFAVKGFTAKDAKKTRKGRKEEQTELWKLSCIPPHGVPIAARPSAFCKATTFRLKT